MRKLCCDTIFVSSFRSYCFACCQFDVCRDSRHRPFCFIEIIIKKPKISPYKKPGELGIKNDEILFNEYLFFVIFIHTQTHTHTHTRENVFFIALYLFFSYSESVNGIYSIEERWEYYEYKILCNHTLCFLLLFLCKIYFFWFHSRDGAWREK